VEIGRGFVETYGDLMRLMGKVRSFEVLDVWQMGKDLVLSVYELTNSFPKEETYGMISQIRRAALSVPANIAEGFGRYHYLDKAKFYLNARGSLYELKSHLLISRELGFCSGENALKILDIVETLSVKLNNLIDSTRKRAK